MKFISCIASMMLIAMISQHPIMGSPIHDRHRHRAVDEKCPEGSSMIDSECKRIKSKLDDIKMEVTTMESTTLPVEKPTTEPLIDNKKEVTTLPVEKPVVSEDVPSKEKLIDNKMEFSTLPSEQPVGGKEKPIDELDTTEKSRMCLEGMKHDKDGICQKITILETTEMNVYSTTEFDEHVGGVENVNGCPKGKQRDEEGSCQEISPSTPVKQIFDPKSLLKPNGTCPDDYILVQGQCLYTANTDSVTDQDGLPVKGMQPKASREPIDSVRLVPVLSDNSCQDGTSYVDNGLCRLLIRPVTSKDICPATHELVHGECIVKLPKPDRSELTTPFTKPEHKARGEEPTDI